VISLLPGSRCELADIRASCVAIEKNYIFIIYTGCHFRAVYKVGFINGDVGSAVFLPKIKTRKTEKKKALPTTVDRASVHSSCTNGWMEDQ
jgi:hypothetical protein